MDLLFLFFCEVHILDVGVKEALLLLVTPFIAITVLFLVTQVTFVLLLHYKENKPEEMEQEERPHS